MRGRNVLILILQLQRYQATPSLCQTAWVDVLWMCDAATTHCSGTQLTPQGSQTLLLPFFFPPPPVISPPLILSPLISLQQSITTMPEERRSCRCRLETRCTYLRRMKVRIGFTDDGHDQSWHSNVGHVFLSSQVPLLFCVFSTR